MNIAIDDLNFSRNSKVILDHLCLNFADRKITAVTGHNGSGKSTLLKAAAGILTPDSGKIFYDDTDIRKLSATALARKRAVILQTPHYPENTQVDELLSLARYAHRSGKTADCTAIEQALLDAGCTQLRSRRLGTLSGGEMRRVSLAMALAQEPQVLFADELEANLDAASRAALPGLLRSLRATRDLTIVIVSHDLDSALQYADFLIGMQEGKIALSTAVDTPETLDRLQKFTGEKFDFFTGSNGRLRALPKYD